MMISRVGDPPYFFPEKTVRYPAVGGEVIGQDLAEFLAFRALPIVHGFREDRRLAGFGKDGTTDSHGPPAGEVNFESIRSDQ